MIMPLILLSLSLGGVAAALFLPGLSDLILLAVPATLASLWLLARAAMARTPLPPLLDPDAVTPRRSRARLGRRSRPKWIVVDGSNVMHWQDETPRIKPLQDVLAELAARDTPPASFSPPMRLPDRGQVSA
jgi:hypothetical protein